MSKRNHLPNGDYKLLKLNSIHTKTSFSKNKNCTNKEALKDKPNIIPTSKLSQGLLKKIQKKPRAR